MNKNHPEYLLLSVALSSFLSFASLSAHCDRLDGPVALAAVEALDSGRFETIQIWVGVGQEEELREVFDEAVVVRKGSRQAKRLADRYFIETAVRLHRAAEGMPYAGVRPAGLPLPPDVKAAEEALESGDLRPLVRLLNGETEDRVSVLYQEAANNRRQLDSSVEAGRQWVDSYVRFIVYAHGLYTAIQAGPEHGVGD